MSTPRGARARVTALIYIGGYGRSGSTLLESLLTTRPDILACGEVVSCFRDCADRGCTCGKSPRDCDVWGPFYQAPNGPRGMSHAALTLALLDRASDRYAFLVDSSKTAWGSLAAPFTLRRSLRDRFHLVHVVRDPRAVCWSNAGGTRKRGGLVRFPSLRHLRMVGRQSELRAFWLALPRAVPARALRGYRAVAYRGSQNAVRRASDTKRGRASHRDARQPAPALRQPQPLQELRACREFEKTNAGRRKCPPASKFLSRRSPGLCGSDTAIKRDVSSARR